MNCSNALSLKMLQFWKISTKAVPEWAAAALRVSCRCCLNTSTDRATNPHSAPRARLRGFRGESTDPKGVDLVLFPSSEVGEYCPLVSP